LNVLLNAVYDLGSTQLPADYQAAANQLLARQKRRALVVLVTNLRDDDDQVLGAVRRLSAQHRVLVASLREEALDTLRQTPVQTLPEALAYCGTIDFLNDRSQRHERLTAHGVAVMDVRPAELGAGLVTSYMSWKKTAAI
jgi:uncharacterized protein (DUF58 family)